MYGSHTPFPAVFNVSDLNGQNGFTVNGINQNDYSGISVSGAGDINADGVDDIIIGAMGVNSYAGAAYVIFGSQWGFPEFFDLTSLNGSNGFIITNTNNSLGRLVNRAGDINGDGIDDIIICNNIQTYILFGSQEGFPAVFDLINLNGSNGFAIISTDPADPYAYIQSISGAGDVNGDGIDDIILGAPGLDGYKGQSYVLYGSRALVEEPLIDISVE